MNCSKCGKHKCQHSFVENFCPNGQGGFSTACEFLSMPNDNSDKPGYVKGMRFECKDCGALNMLYFPKDN